MRNRALAVIFCFLVLPLAAKKNDVVLTRADGKTVTVPMTGALHDERAESLAREIQALDVQIRDARASASSSEAAAAMLAVAIESREDAVRELDLALAVARVTSAGKLDDESIAKAQDYASSANTVLTSRTPASILVATDISTSVPNATLHYISKAKYDTKSKEWSSYNEGERMRIGRYVFRVQPADAGAVVFDEFVLVTSDPTKKRLSPMLAGNP